LQNTSSESIPTQKGESLAQSAVTSPEAFAELYRLYLPQVYRYHLARSGDQSTAQDLTAQTFIAALEGLPGFRGQGSFIAWLMGIARRKLALHYRSQRRHFPLEEADSLPDPADPPDVRVDTRLNLRQLKLSACASLPSSPALKPLRCLAKARLPSKCWFYAVCVTCEIFVRFLSRRLNDVLYQSPRPGGCPG
jgi:RNA polymerase sigma factor (sigma-70 family)